MGAVGVEPDGGGLAGPGGGGWLIGLVSAPAAIALEWLRKTATATSAAGGRGEGRLLTGMSSMQWVGKAVGGLLGFAAAGPVGKARGGEGSGGRPIGSVRRVTTGQR